MPRSVDAAGKWEKFIGNKGICHIYTVVGCMCMQVFVPTVYYKEVLDYTEQLSACLRFHVIIMLIIMNKRF